MTPSFAVDHGVKCQIGNIRPLDLHNGCNDAHWEVWCTFRLIDQGLGLSQYTGMERFQSSKSLAATRRVEGGKVTEKGPLRVKAGEKGRFRKPSPKVGNWSGYVGTIEPMIRKLGRALEGMLCLMRRQN